MLSKYIIPIVVLIIVLYGYKSKIDLYNSFINGSLDGLRTIVDIIPPIFALLLAVNVFVNSGILEKIFNFWNSEIITLGILRPISGNAALGMLENIFSKYGPDSFNGVLGSIMQGSTDTTFYILALYFSSVKIKNTRYALWVGLFADLVAMLVAYIVVIFVF